MDHADTGDHSGAGGLVVVHIVGGQSGELQKRAPGIEQGLDEAKLLVDGVGHDKVEGRFLQSIPDAKALAKRMYKFCPDIVDQGCGTVARLVKELVRTQRFYFWWD